MIEILEISNYYGVLRIKKEAGICYWGIDDWDDDQSWSIIPESLYLELRKFSEQKKIVGQKTNNG